MKICLMYLPHPYLRQPDAQAPIGILYLASVLERAGIDVSVYNCSDLATHVAISHLPQADVYGISITSIELPQANRFAHLIKEFNPNSSVWLGGTGTFTDEFVDWNVIDSICKGDGELTILDMIQDWQKKDLKRIYIGRPVENLDDVPFPARHMIHKQGGNIFAYNRQYKGNGSTIILSSRGCPFKCSFCASPKFTGDGVRFRSPESVVEEMKEVMANHDIFQFRFSDDMFTANKDRLLRLCDLVRPLGVVWRISCRVKPFDRTMAEALYSAGCKEVSLGVESFDNNVLSMLNKKTTAEDNAEALRICKEVGIVTRVLFMIRTPGQTPVTVKRNIEWLEKVPYDIIACTSFVPLPGSDIWDNPDKYGIEILSRNLDDYNFYFFGRNGENKLKDVIRIKWRTIWELNEESQQFRNYLKGTGKLNEG